MWLLQQQLLLLTWPHRTTFLKVLFRVCFPHETFPATSTAKWFRSVVAEHVIHEVVVTTELLLTDVADVVDSGLQFFPCDGYTSSAGGTRCRTRRMKTAALLFMCFRSVSLVFSFFPKRTTFKLLLEVRVDIGDVTHQAAFVCE